MTTAAPTAPAVAGVRAMAAILRARGVAVCKPDPREKKPTYKGWSTRSLEVGDFSAGDQIGILAGPLSDCKQSGHSLVIVDLDSPESVDRAGRHLPPTGMMEGRPGKPLSHRYYLVPNKTIPEWACSTAEQGAPAAEEMTGHPGAFIKSFRHRGTGKEVVRVLGTGGQVVCPPATWADGVMSECREWEGGVPGIPARVEFLELWQALCELASSCGAEVPDVVPRPIPRPPTPPFGVVERASKWLAKVPGAVSGQNGHGQTFWAARGLVYGFDLDAQTAHALLVNEYNPRCRPAWSERDLRHKLEDADRIPFNKSRGWLRDERGPERTGAARISRSGFGTATNAPPVANGRTQNEQPGQAEPAAAVVSRSLAEIETREVEWLWKGWLPAGMLSILDGDPSEGKSVITIDIAARLSRGRRMPLGGEQSDPCCMMMMAAEDSAEHTIKPRGIAAGADLDLVRVCECIRIGDAERPIRLPDDIKALERELIAHRARLLVIDPFLGFLSQAVDSHKDQSVRDVLHELKLMAGRTGCAVLGLRHLSKANSGGNALYRGMGSIAITAAARSAFTVAPHPTDEGARVMASTKLNLAAKPTSLVYRIRDEYGNPVIDWMGASDLTAADLGAPVGRAAAGGALEQAKDFLLDALAGGAETLQSEIQAKAEAKGVAWASVRRARAALGIRSEKRGFSGRWFWWLPSEGAQEPRGAEGAQNDRDE